MRFLVAAFTFLLVAMSQTQAQDDAPVGSGQGETLAISGEDVGISGNAYTVFVPRGVRPGKLYPLVWTIPDEGESVEDAVRALAPLSTDRRPVYVAGMPNVQEGFAKQDRTSYGELCTGFVKAVLAAHSIDPGRVALHGRGSGADCAAVWSYQHQLDHHDEAPFREIWLSEGGLPQPRDARPTRIRFFVGADADGDDGAGEVVLRTRRAFRSVTSNVYDVWFSERKDSGRGIDEPLRREMRAIIDGWPSYADAFPESAATKPILATARQWALRGQLNETFALLQAAESSDDETRDAARAARRVVEQWLRRHAKAEELRIVRLRSICSYHELAAHRDAQPEDAPLRKLLSAALDRIEASKPMPAELEAELRFKEALVELHRDPRTMRGFLAELSAQELRDTVYGRRARGHLFAQYDR